MKEAEFKIWLKKEGTNKRVMGDCISRLKRVERELGGLNLDEEYKNDHCEFVLGAFLNMGHNDSMKKFPNANLPFGKYYMCTYRFAIKKYVEFCDSINAVKQK